MKDILVALDLGASKTKLVQTQLGYILNEPSFVVYDKEKVFGNKATEKIASFNSFSSIINNLDIQNENDFIEYILYLFDKCEIEGYIKNVFVATNNASNVNQLSKIEKCLIECDAIKVKFINSALCAYNYLKKDNSTRLIVDIGASKTDITLVKNDVIINGINLNIGCNTLDKKIIDYCSQYYSIVITPVMAENIRKNIASLDSSINNSYSFYGISVNGNKFAKNNISTIDIKNLIENFYLYIYTAIETLLNMCDIAVLDEIKENGVDFIGGGSLIKGLCKFFGNKFDIQCNTYSNATDIIALGLENYV